MYEIVKYAERPSDALVVAGAISLFPMIWNINIFEKSTDQLHPKAQEPMKVFLYGLIGMAGLLKFIQYGVECSRK